MLINLSNHPSTQWHQNQLKEAQNKFGEVIDIPFPSIDPNSSSAQIREFAHDYILKCCSELTLYHGKNAVHVMGEFTLTYLIVNGLINRGIECVCSTTERIVEEDGNKKITLFKFIRFREYSNY